MIINNKVRTKYKIKKRNKLHLILSSIQRNLEDHDKKEDDKK